MLPRKQSHGLITSTPLRTPSDFRLVIDPPTTSTIKDKPEASTSSPTKLSPLTSSANAMAPSHLLRPSSSSSCVRVEYIFQKTEAIVGTSSAAGMPPPRSPKKLSEVFDTTPTETPALTMASTTSTTSLGSPKRQLDSPKLLPLHLSVSATPAESRDGTSSNASRLRPLEDKEADSKRSGPGSPMIAPLGGDASATSSPALAFVSPTKQLCVVCCLRVRSHDTGVSLAEHGVCHAECFKCAICQCSLLQETFRVLNKRLFCATHATQEEQRMAPSTTSRVLKKRSKAAQPKNKAVLPLASSPTRSPEKLGEDKKASNLDDAKDSKDEDDAEIDVEISTLHSLAFNDSTHKDFESLDADEKVSPGDPNMLTISANFARSSPTAASKSLTSSSSSSALLAPKSKVPVSPSALRTRRELPSIDIIAPSTTTADAKLERQNSGLVTCKTVTSLLTSAQTPESQSQDKDSTSSSGLPRTPRGPTTLPVRKTVHTARSSSPPTPEAVEVKHNRVVDPLDRKPSS